MTYRLLPPVLLLALTLLGCAPADDPGPETALPPDYSAALQFVEQEPGLEPYPMRMLVTAAYLRMDDGTAEGDYVLYDRATRSISAVNHMNRTVLRIDYRAVEIDPPLRLRHETRTELDPEAPAVDGAPVAHHRLFTNGELCYQVVAADGLLEPARVAIGEYVQALAGEQALNLAKTPMEMQTPCTLATLVFAPDAHLQRGFPLREWRGDGFNRALVGFEEGVELDPALFRLPEGYGSFSLH